MGLLDRVHDSITGLGNALEAPVGLVGDLVRAPTDPRGIVDATYHDLLDRSGQAVSGLVGPDGAVGSLAGGLPEPVRAPFGAAMRGSQGAMDELYGQLVNQPLTTAMTVGSLADAPGGGGYAGLLSPKNWGEAWNTAQHRSLGQSVALAFMTKDINNPAQVRKAQGSDMYHAASGLVDAVTRWELDPTQIIGSAATGYLHELHLINSDAAIDHLAMNGKLDKAVNDIMDMAETAPNKDVLASQIRNKLAPKSYLGDQHAAVLADATVHGHAEVERSMRALLGDTRVLPGVNEAPAEIRGQIERLTQQQERVAQTSEGGWDSVNTAEHHDGLDAEFDALYDAHDRAVRLDQAAGSLRELPHASPLTRLRAATTMSDWYQRSTLAAPLRVAFQQAPAHMVQFDSPMSDATMFHFMQQSDMPLQRQLELRGKWLNATQPGERTQLYDQAIAESVQSIADSTATKLSANNVDTWLQNSAGLTDEARAQHVADYAAAAKGSTTSTAGAVWHNADGDMPVTVLGSLGEGPDGRVYARIAESSSGVPMDEITGVTTAAAMSPREAKLAVLKRAAKDAGLPMPGMTKTEMEQHLAQAAELRQKTNDILAERMYDGEGRSLVRMVGEDGVATHMYTIERPLYETQLANLGVLPDLRLYRQATSKVGQFRMRHPWTDLPATLAKDYYNIWKPATLLRIGFPLRILTDEGLRTASKVGALAESKMFAKGTADWLAQTGAVAPLEKLGIDWEREGPGMRPYMEGEHMLEGMFGSKDDGAVIYKTLGKARTALASDVVTAEGGIYQSLKSTGHWRSYAPNEYGHGAAWQRDVNMQLGYSQLAKNVIADKLAGVDDPTAINNAVKWLSSTPEGHDLAREIGRKDLQQWAEAVNGQINTYVPTDELKHAALGQYATPELLHDEFDAHPEQFAGGVLPTVHGEVLKQELGTSPLIARVKGWRDKLYDGMVDKPDEFIIRTPFMDHMYQAEARRQVQQLTGQREYSFTERMIRRAKGMPEQSEATNFAVTQHDLDRITRNARRYALGETKNLLHDFSEQSRLGEMLRFTMPFFSAWQQIGTRWAGIALDNPGYVRRLDMLWQSPEKAGIVTDGKGNLIDEDGNITHPVEGGIWKKGDPAADGERNVTLSIPSWAKDVPVVGKGLPDQFKFGKDALNLMLHGFPTFGPLQQVPVNEIAKQRPDLAASLKWALPYGVQQNSLDILKPTIVKHISQEAEGDANRSHAYTTMQIFNDAVVDYNLGKRKTQPTWKEAQNKSDMFWHIRNLASFVMPMTPRFVSPYQHYIDSYRARLTYDGTLTPDQKRAPDYQSPKDWFLKTYGEEFFPLTTSMSKSIDGIPPTVKGFEMRKEYKDLIAQNPELGALIVGQTGAGSFSQAVYDSQFQTAISPGGPKERTVRAFPDFASDPQKELGWTYFSKNMDMIDSLMHQRGLPNLQVRAAADLAAMKKNLVFNLATKYPAWFEDYSSTDRTKWEQRISGMTRIVNTKGMTDRPEFAGLAQYLKGRDQMTQVLEAAKSHNLSAAQNAALMNQWHAYTGQLVAQNPAFAALFYRWLQNDPVGVNPLTEAASAGTLQTGQAT